MIIFIFIILKQALVYEKINDKSKNKMAKKAYYY